jgi:transcriptional regulator with XRE-family HTH domain
MSLSTRLLQLRKQRDWTQQELAEAVGIHVNQVRRYEAGTAQPSLDVLKSLARVFAVSTDSLLFDEDERQPPDDLRLQFEAMREFSPEERAIARALIESLILRHSAHRFAREPSSAS